MEAFADIGVHKPALAPDFALNDKDASLRTGAVDALGEIGGETAIRILQQALADERAAETAKDNPAEHDGTPRVRVGSGGDLVYNCCNEISGLGCSKARRRI